jgi:hypothetical protein
MRILIINTDYVNFLHYLYAQNPGLAQKSYEEQMAARNQSLFGVADFYSRQFCALGHEAVDIHSNNEFLQNAWANENGFLSATDAKWRFRLRGGFVPWISRARDDRWFYRILAAQIKKYKPDVLINHDPVVVDGRFLATMKPYVRFFVGQIASQIPPGTDFKIYNLMISSLRNLVLYFQKMGIHAQWQPLGFESRILQFLPKVQKDIPLSFVGSLFTTHQARLRLLEYLCERCQIQIWGHGIEGLPKNSPIRRCYHGEAWGLDMYKILQRSHIALNCHSPFAESFANNMRLFEATGVGALLLTEQSDNLSELFEPGREVVAYENREQCVDRIHYYLDHREERQAIAWAGQERTLGAHTYAARAKELLAIMAEELKLSN